MSVSIIAPFTRTFCLARKVFDGVSITFVIFADFAFPLIIMLASSAEKDTNFSVLPLPLSSFVFLSPSLEILAWFCLPVSFLFLTFLYLPPDAFLPVIMY